MQDHQFPLQRLHKRSECAPAQSRVIHYRITCQHVSSSMCSSSKDVLSMSQWHAVEYLPPFSCRKHHTYDDHAVGGSAAHACEAIKEIVQRSHRLGSCGGCCCSSRRPEVPASYRPQQGAHLMRQLDLAAAQRRCWPACSFS